MGQENLPSARIPSATYRLQFNAQFTFADARQIIGYLNDLGISDVYASSYLGAKEGSVHGYDVVNQTVLNREVGSEESHRAMVEEMQRFGMGHILDFVPNHMCIESGENVWWMDVLENGMSSPYAHFFDIDWEPVKKELTGKVLLPFLGDQYGKVLENGELRLLFREGGFFVQCSRVQIPVEPKSYLQILGHRLESLQGLFPPEAPPLLELLSIDTALQHLPPATEQDPEKQAERHREKEIVKKRLWQLCQESPEVAAFIDENVVIFNGAKGEPASFDLLDGLLRDQVYRLSFWRVATEEINYRRFFDINALAAIRMENQAVFDQTHQLLFRLIREGKVTGVRIDHVDGLYDPIVYLQGLQKSCYLELRHFAAGNGSAGGGAAEGTAARREGWEEEYRQALEQNPCYQPLYVVCEKILMKGEQLPEQWPVSGTTGYEFLNNLNGIFVDTEKARAFDRIYQRFAGRVADFPEVVYEKKKLVMEVSLSGEGNMLAHQLNNISEQDRLTRDFTLNSLSRAISEVIACFPVYRTYANSGAMREKDVQYIEGAVAKAKRKNPAISGSFFDFVRDVLLFRFPERATESDRRAWINFVMRFQQITGPVMAKGLEDTAFYVYNRLISLNDVGGMPGRFGTPLEAFHGQNLERIKTFPHSMIASATHDSKRGEDVRARIDVLSEIPEVWQKSLVRWSRLNKAKTAIFENQTVPDRNEEYLLYQTLLGVWPALETDREGFERFRGRIREYMTKAMREAKVHSSWVSPNTAYEEAVLSFVDQLLSDDPGNGFLPEFLPLQRGIARCGIFNSLSQVLLKMVSPGVPDFYQGTELWDFTLVDPDNRHPVDYRCRMEALAGLKGREAEIGAQALFRELQESCGDGRVKLYLIFRVLNYRRENRDLFDQGDYLPLEAQGARSRHLCAFARRVSGRGFIAVAPRLVATLAPEPDISPLGEQAWLDTFLVLPEGAGSRFRNVISDEEIDTVERAGRRGIPLALLFAAVPVALLEPV
ncbi:MAG: malto-oligosyltrehalose synthase [Geobacteraceae bacterium GWC2_58_44]|nr:MAG: malto-oligosyltrehalose synthase [Geobacteraceae bacterium GWC2_58_44]HBG07000.1 malto-oligosyltrehalose synthase [Geobacter sp.]